MKRQPEARAHGEAWVQFTQAMIGKVYGEDATRNAWLWFLDGWLAKATQHDRLRHRR